MPNICTISGTATLKALIEIFSPSFLERALKGLSTLSNLKIFTKFLLLPDYPTNSDRIVIMMTTKSRKFHPLRKYEVDPHSQSP